jgi:hypothetical protein
VVVILPSDFFMFSPRVFFRQIESYNLALWPLQILMLLVGVGLVCLRARAQPNASRIVATVLGCALAASRLGPSLVASVKRQLGRHLRRLWLRRSLCSSFMLSRAERERHWRAVSRG